MKQIQIPRIVFGAASSGSGKTTITCGILQALKNRGLEVASFKCGPDYIDPMFHSKVIGTKSRNLDSYLAPENIVKYLFANTSFDMDLSVIEGVMGYYDGLGGVSTKASTYDIASITQSPTILILNGKGMSLSLIATLLGFLSYRKDSNIKGIILNHMSPMFYETIKGKVEEELKIPVLGYVPKLQELSIDSRHLGLISPDEVEGFKEKIISLAKVFEETLDLDKIIEIAKSAPVLEYEIPKIPYCKHTVRIGIARDEAFSFYYEDNLDLLKQMGAELCYFSPIKDKELPKGLDGLIFGGGYPELHAKELSSNKSMRASIMKAVVDGMPCIGECGGFLYLHDELEDAQGVSYPMVGVIQAKAYKTHRLQRFGYIELESLCTSVIGEPRSHLRAHEFHYYESGMPGDDFMATKPIGNRTYPCIHGKENVLAGFPHLYLYGNVEAAYQLIEACLRYRDNK